MKTKIIRILFLSVFIFGCKNDVKENKIETKTESKAVKQEEHHHHEKEVIVLNGGQKWKVVDHMMAHLQDMENDVNHFNGKSLEDYQKLTEKLQENIDLLTSNCTMEGQAHDELHKWLVPYIHLIKDFSKVKTIKEAGAYYQKVKVAFVTFNQFFN